MGGRRSRMRHAPMCAPTTVTQVRPPRRPRTQPSTPTPKCPHDRLSAGAPGGRPERARDQRLSWWPGTRRRIRGGPACPTPTTTPWRPRFHPRWRCPAAGSRPRGSRPPTPRPRARSGQARERRIRPTSSSPPQRVPVACLACRQVGRRARSRAGEPRTSGRRARRRRSVNRASRGLPSSSHVRNLSLSVTMTHSPLGLLTSTEGGRG